MKILKKMIAVCGFLNVCILTPSSTKSATSASSSPRSRTSSHEFLSQTTSHLVDKTQSFRYSLITAIEKLQNNEINPLLSQLDGKFSQESQRYQDFSKLADYLYRVKLYLNNQERTFDRWEITEKAQRVEERLLRYKQNSSRFDAVTSTLHYNQLTSLCAKIIAGEM